MKNDPLISSPHQSLSDSSLPDEEDMQENATVNPVHRIEINHKYPTPKKVMIKSSNSMLPEVIDFVERPKSSNVMKTMPRFGLLNRRREKNKTEQAPVKYGTFGTIQRMKLVKTDSVAIDLAKFRMERKGSIESKYEVLYTLGTGSYGEVQMIRDLETNELKAVKVISKEKCSTVDKYNEEIEILKNLVIQVVNYRIILMY